MAVGQRGVGHAKKKEAVGESMRWLKEKFLIRAAGGGESASVRRLKKKDIAKTNLPIGVWETSPKGGGLRQKNWGGNGPLDRTEMGKIDGRRKKT